MPVPADGLLATARTLAVDALTGEVVAALRAAGLRCMLIKGPTIALWLYDPRAPRSYVDTDLLVAPRDLDAAQRVLEGLGFAPGPADDAVGEPHSRPWLRGTQDAVDVHRTLFGAAAAPEVVWRELSATAGRMRLGTVEVDVPSRAGRVLIAALHAAQHEGAGHSAEDVRRAIEQAGDAAWREAAELARRLDATHTLALGLAGAPGGPELAADLGLPSAALVRTALDERSRAPLALGIDRLARSDGWRARGALVWREAVPSPDHLRFTSALARRGRWGLALAYVLRPLWLVRHAPASIAAWRRARLTDPGSSTGWTTGTTR
jgi:hypothetical protein